MMRQKLLLLFITLSELFAYLVWLSCAQLSDRFHFSPFDLQLRLIERIHNDQYIPLWEIRAFHNKFTGSFFDVINSYVHFWDIPFLISIISLVGVVGVIIMFYSFFSQKRTHLRITLFILLLITPFIELFHISSIPFFVRLSLIVGLLIIWSLLGYWQVIRKKNMGKYILFLIFLSVWYQVALSTSYIFCQHP